MHLTQITHCTVQYILPNKNLKKAGAAILYRKIWKNDCNNSLF